MMLAMVASACGSSGDSDEASSTTTSQTATSTSTTTTDTSATTTAPTTTTTEVEVDEAALDARSIVEILASDEMNGRNNQTPGSAAARTFLVEQLSQFAEPVFPDVVGDEGYFQPFDLGTNVLAVIPGGELADEYVMIGAHYDHHGNDCRGITTDDNICNGAADNATGVAAALTIAIEGTPRRSLIVALWDVEEDGLLGSKAYVADPIIPLVDMVAYVNFDIQGANLLPSLANATILVGAETGGPNLVDAATRAANDATLDTVRFSLLFGQGRSDHAVLVSAGVPSVFFTDANTGCYHTVKDDVTAIDFDKLEQQIATADALSRDLINTDDPPVLDDAAPLTTYEDAVELLRLVELAESDFVLFESEQQASSEEFLTDLRGVVDAGADGFDNAAAGILLGGAIDFVSTLAGIECDPFLTFG